MQFVPRLFAFRSSKITWKPLPTPTTATKAIMASSCSWTAVTFHASSTPPVHHHRVSTCWSTKCHWPYHHLRCKRTMRSRGWHRVIRTPNTEIHVIKYAFIQKRIFISSNTSSDLAQSSANHSTGDTAKSICFRKSSALSLLRELALLRVARGYRSNTVHV